MGVSFKSNVGGFHLTNGKRTILMTTTGQEDSVGVGMYAFTKAGGEILSLFLDDEFTAVDGYFEEVCDHFRGQGFAIQEVDD